MLNCEIVLSATRVVLCWTSILKRSCWKIFKIVRISWSKRPKDQRHLALERLNSSNRKRFKSLRIDYVDIKRVLVDLSYSHGDSIVETNLLPLNVQEFRPSLILKNFRRDDIRDSFSRQLIKNFDFVYDRFLVGLGNVSVGMSVWDREFYLVNILAVLTLTERYHLDTNEHKQIKVL